MERDFEFQEFDRLNEIDESHLFDKDISEDEIDRIMFGKKKRICAHCCRPIKRGERWCKDQYGLTAHREC